MRPSLSTRPAEPEPHFPSPYRRPTSPLVMARRVETGDGAQIAAFVYAPDAGEGPDLAGERTVPVLLLHGNGEEHGIFGPIIDAAVTAGRTVVAVDSRAQGKSTRGTAPLTYELMAADAVAVLDALSVCRVHVAGFSDGAILALLIARDHPERVASLLSIGANLTPEGVLDDDWDMAGNAERNRAWSAYWSETSTEIVAGASGDTSIGWNTSCGVEAGAPSFSAILASSEAEGASPVMGVQNAASSTDVAVRSAVDPSLLFCDPAQAAIQAELLQLMIDHPHIEAASLGGIACPACVMAGEHDCIVPEQTAQIAKAIPGARLVVVPKMGHSLPKHAPADVARELLINILLTGR